MKENIENNENYHTPVKIQIPREISKKTSTDAETYNNLNSIYHKIENENDIQSTESKNSKSPKKSQKKNVSAYRRVDSFGNPILKNGKQKISFIDKITTNNFVEVIKVNSYKAYNKMEEIHSGDNMQNNCCLII